MTRRFVDAVAGTNAGIYDTRKTTPGLRKLERVSVIGMNEIRAMLDHGDPQDDMALLVLHREEGGRRVYGDPAFLRTHDLVPALEHLRDEGAPGMADLLPELARYGRQDPHDNGPERIPERRASRRASGRLAERIRAP